MVCYAATKKREKREQKSNKREKKEGSWAEKRVQENHFNICVFAAFYLKSDATVSNLY